MNIKEMFKKEIDRDIKGVIKVGQKDDEDIYQELNEYIVTHELLKHFREFFESYKKGIGQYTDDMGVWISGFFGSGKSHFLKILSYILENKEVHGKKALDFFKEDKITDSTVIADMSLSSTISTDVILFNIDAKSSTSEYKENAILDVFLKVFNEFSGFSASYPFLADFERKLTEEDVYDNFINEFEKINGNKWVDEREDFYFIQDDIMESLSNINYMSKEAAINWAEKAEENYNNSISIEKFSKLIHEYLESKGNDHHLIFLVDEVGQYIGDNSKLMLNLQTLTEELGTKCGGKAWIVVTSQEAIDSIVDVKGDDFSKIQGRFKTRLSLSSANVDEVIRKRILAKNEVGEKTLIALYEEKEAVLKNLIHFEDAAEMKKYSGSENFSQVYPFIPYQFNLLGNVLKAIREHGASGKHLSEGERSMLALFQESGIEMMNREEGVLVPFNIFYNPLAKFVDSAHSSVIIKATNNDNLDKFDVKVLKVLFMIKYVKEIKANINNLTTLLVEYIETDRVDLREKIEKSLKNLENETLIQRNGEIYTFLTNEEQDINAAIKNEHIETGEIQNEVSNIIYEDIFSDNKFAYNKRYNFEFNKAVDGRYKGNRQGNDIGVNIITSYKDLIYHNDSSQKQLTPEAEEEKESRILRAMSENKELIINVRNSSNFLTEIEEYLKIDKYLNKHATNLSENYNTILVAKRQESSDKRERAKIFIMEALEEGDIYIDGEKSRIVSKNPSSRINEGLKNLVDKVYFKLKTLEIEPSEADIKNAIIHPDRLIYKENLAVDELMNFIDRKTLNHSKPLLKTVFSEFKKAPYGFVDEDIRWLLAVLFGKKLIYLIKNSEQITIQKNTPMEIIRFLKDRKLQEKIIIDKKVGIPANEIKVVKNVLKEFFSVPNTPNDDEELKDLFFKEAKIFDNFGMILSKYDVEKRYPGKTVIKEVKELFKELNRIKSTKEFYGFVSDKENVFLNLHEDIGNVKTFFNGKQDNIFREACDIIDLYENNQYLISNNEKLKSDIVSIKTIIEMNSPFSNIHKLPNLTASFKEEFEKIINKEKNIVQAHIDSDKEQIMNNLSSKELKEKFESEVESRYDEIIKTINKTNDIPKIKSFREVSEKLRIRFIEKIEKYNESTPKNGNGNSSPPTPIKNININIKEIINDKHMLNIKEEKDIDDFIETLKKNLKERLKEIDEKGSINLRFY
jgi:hypothetical protein